VHPGVERGGVAQRARAADRGDGDVLRDVGGRLGIAEDASAVRRATCSARAATCSSERVSGRLTASAPAWSMVVIAF
jgi:hypothetical protein